MILLYNRCEATKSLPNEVLEQDEKTMQAFDLIRELYGEYQMFELDRKKAKMEAETTRRKNAGIKHRN